MKNIRFISIELLFSLAVSLTAYKSSDGGADTNGDPSATDNTAVTTEAADDGVITLDEVFGMDVSFGNEDIRFLVELGIGNDMNYVETLFVESNEGDVVDMAVYDRCLAISEKIGLNVVIAQTVSSTTVTYILRKTVQSGSDDYDIASVYQSYSCAASARTIRIYTVSSETASGQSRKTLHQCV